MFEAFATHPLVGLGDDHGVARAMEFYEALVRDPRFAHEAGNLVVEFGAAGRQDVADRYVAGETVPYSELRTIWSDTVGWIPPAGHLGFARLLAAVREVNKGLAADRRIRVWLGEPPVDWATATLAETMAAQNRRDSHPAELIEREILAKGRKALVIYGGFHFGQGGWLRGRVEAGHPGAFFVVLGGYGVELNKPGACASQLARATQVWPAPALAVRDPAQPGCTTLDARPAGWAFSLGPGGTPAGYDLLAEGDAVLLLGPRTDLTMGPVMPDYALDPELRREMHRRAQIGGPRLVRFPPGYVLRKADYAVDLDAPGFAEAIEAMFARFDTDGDGVVTGAEYLDPVPM